MADAGTYGFGAGTTPVVFPPAGTHWLYIKLDGLLYKMNSAGVESLVDTGGVPPLAFHAWRLFSGDNLSVPDGHEFLVGEELQIDAGASLTIAAGGRLMIISNPGPASSTQAGLVSAADYSKLLAIPSNAASTAYVDNPGVRVAAAGFTVGFADFGKVIALTGAGAQAGVLPDLSLTGFPDGHLAIVMFVLEGAATAPTITPDAGVNINGANVAWVLTPGYGTASIMTRDGKNWFHA